MTIRFVYTGSGYANTDLSAYDTGFLLGLFRSMLRIRRIEEVVEARYKEDQMKTPIHLVIGQEATSVGVCAALQVSDGIYSTHRTHGNYLAKGGDLKAMLSEFYCRANGCCGSRGGSMHLLDKSVGMDGSSAIVGASVPLTTGAAFAAKMKRKGRVVCGFFGDAASEEGGVWESLNLAALWRLPAVYVCENNFFSVCSPLESRQPPGVEIYKKAAAFGVKAVQVDGTNVLTVYNAAKEAVERARNGQGPTLIESVAYRWRGHGGAGDDSHTGYRDPAEVRAWEQSCPVEGFAAHLTTHGLLTAEARQIMEQEIQQEIDEGFEHAINSPNPTREDLLTFVYSN